VWRAMQTGNHAVPENPQHLKPGSGRTPARRRTDAQAIGYMRVTTDMLPRVVTTSWDDGNLNDMRVAEFLQDRHLWGTFYVPITGRDGRSIVRGGDLRALLSQGFEIGAHGTSHSPLTQFYDRELAWEIGVCKRKLQDVLGATVPMFCYPKGQYNGRIIREVERAGYAGARTTEMLRHDLDMDPYRMSTTLHAFPHNRTAYLKNMARALNFNRALDWAIHYRHAHSWVELAKRTFDQVIRDGGVWHLYGHSWAIEKYDLWAGLGKVLEYVSRREGVKYLSNSEVLKYLPRYRQSAPGQ
jgi:peptidoglycan-N-acetylglucosamine deacetylase